jgi:hypothetical protein
VLCGTKNESSTVRSVGRGALIDLRRRREQATVPAPEKAGCSGPFVPQGRRDDNCVLVAAIYASERATPTSELTIVVDRLQSAGWCHDGRTAFFRGLKPGGYITR